MTTQPEQILEDSLVAQLVGMDYEKVDVHDEAALLENLMVLRPYQVYATEAIVEKVQHGRGYGYVWHTTGSGKTLTSFNLRPRFESKTPDCTNCKLCTEACTTELGQGNTLFHLVDPELEASDAS